MKHVLIAVLALGICSASFAGGELPAPINYAPAPQPVYYNPQPVYVPAPQPVVVVERKGGIVGYAKNRWFDVTDVVFQTFDAVVGVVTIDPAKDDQY